MQKNFAELDEADAEREYEHRRRAVLERASHESAALRAATARPVMKYTSKGAAPPRTTKRYRVPGGGVINKFVSGGASAVPTTGGGSPRAGSK